MQKISLPKYYIIESTNTCNFQCSICPNSLSRKMEKGNISLELCDKLLSQISSVAEVIQLYWLGEPLLNPDIFELINRCKRKTKAKVMLSTNGSLLTEQIIQSLIDSGLDEMIISVDACECQDVYSSIRVGGDINKLNSNIEMLLKKNKRIKITLQFIDMYVNRFEKQGFIDRWKKYDCQLEISCLYTWANQIPSLNLASDNLSPVIMKERVPCADLYNKMAIHWDGIVSACCFDFDNKLVIGDSNIKSLIDIWNDEPINKIRRMHEQGSFNKVTPCNHCDAWAEPDEYETLFHLE